MATRGVDFKWYDGFFLSMLATSIIFVATNWKRYYLCSYPLNIWIVLDYSAVFIFRLLMFLDNGLAAGMGLDHGRQQRYARFVGRLVVLSILSLWLYPFLWAWTVIGTYWFSRGKTCLLEQGQKWGFLVWLLLSYSGLLFIASVMVGKWLTRRQALLERAHQGNHISVLGVLVDMIRVPQWAFEAGQEMGGMVQEATHLPGLYSTQVQMEAMEALIQNLPKFRLMAVPSDCSECPICLEDFHVEDEVRGLRCAHHFHTECIDKWLRLNARCPRCRCCVFSNLDFSALSNIQSNSEGSSFSVVTATYVRNPPPSQSYILRMQGLLGAESVGPVNRTDVERGTYL